jgi:deoxyhypusine synthase
MMQPSPEQHAILPQLVPLKPLDLSACRTVSDIVRGMSHCSFGARMLGEAADTLTAWVKEDPRPVLVHDGNPKKPLFGLLRGMCERGWFEGPLRTWDLKKHGKTFERGLVVGPYAEYFEDDLYAFVRNAVFVNDQYQCRPGQVKYGHFPNVVFADPSFVMNVLNLAMLERLDQSEYGTADLMKAIENLPGTAGEIARGARTLRAMLDDERCTVMLTLSGAMTVGKMQLLICDLLDTGRVKFVSATGALMAHGLVEGAGYSHYKYDPDVTDAELARAKLNRVTDSLEPESNLDGVELILRRVLTDMRDRGVRVSSSHELYRELGKHLREAFPENRAILTSAFRRGVPIVTPAFIDSEIANDVFVFNGYRQTDEEPIIFDQGRDTEVLFNLALESERMGIFTIGGGVPRNNTQNVAPLIDFYNLRLQKGLPPKKFFYGCRIDPAPMFLGHLSGCTYSEGVSWLKFDPRGVTAEIKMDATIAWPFVQKEALEGKAGSG